MSTQKPTDFICSIDVTAGSSLQPLRPDQIATESIAGPLRELVQATRDLVQINREQLELLRRGEERFQQQQKQQRDEFERWISESYDLPGRCEQAQEAVRTVLGQAITDLVQFVEEHQEDLMDSDYVRNDLVDRYGSMLNHVSGMYGMLKRLAAAEKTLSEHPPDTTY